MPLSTRRAVVGGTTYIDRVLNTGPIAYWPLNEISGTIIRCLVNPAQNGTASSDVSTWPPGTGIGDGNTALYFDGTNDWIDVRSATLTAAFSGLTGTLLAWGKVNAVGNWTDAAVHHRARFAVGANNDVREAIYSNNNNQHFYKANGVVDSVNVGSHSETGWFCSAVTWSKTNDQVIGYFNGAREGAISTTLDTWAGDIAHAYIGSDTTTPSNLWHGWIQHVVLWGYPLPASTVALLSRS